MTMINCVRNNFWRQNNATPKGATDQVAGYLGVLSRLPISIRLVLQYQILRCENEEKWRKIWEEEREEIRKAEAVAQARMDAELLKASQKDAAQSRPGSTAGSRGSQGSRPQTSSSKSRPSAKWIVVIRCQSVVQTSQIDLFDGEDMFWYAVIPLARYCRYSSRGDEFEDVRIWLMFLQAFSTTFPCACSLTKCFYTCSSPSICEGLPRKRKQVFEVVLIRFTMWND